MAGLSIAAIVLKCMPDKAYSQELKDSKWAMSHFDKVYMIMIGVSTTISHFAHGSNEDKDKIEPEEQTEGAQWEVKIVLIYSTSRN